MKYSQKFAPAPPTQKATARTTTKKGQCGILAKDSEEICVWCVCVCAIARASAPADPLAWGAHLASAFPRQCQALASTLCLHDFRMHLSCGRLV